MSSDNPGRCCGSAMTEFSILLVAMVPLLVGIPMIGKIIDLRQTAILASRYNAWENTVSQETRMAGQVRERFFSESSAPIVSATRDVESHQLWGKAVNTEQAGQSAIGSVEIDEQSSSAVMPQSGIRHSGMSYSLGKGVEKAGDLLGWAPRTQWGLTGDGLINASVQVDVHNNEWLAGTRSRCGSGTSVYACVTESNAIMVDGWSSGNDTQAKERVRSLVPASGLTQAGNIIANFGRIPVFKELRRLDNAFGHVDMSVLPDRTTARLQSYEEDM